MFIYYNMLVINQKYKPIITKPVQGIKPIKEMTKNEGNYNSSIIQNIQGQGINELIQKVKDIKIKEINKKRHANSNNKISFD